MILNSIRFDYLGHANEIIVVRFMLKHANEFHEGRFMLKHANEFHEGRSFIIRARVLMRDACFLL